MNIQEIVNILSTFLTDYSAFTSGTAVKVTIPAVKVTLPFGLGTADITLGDVSIQKAA